MPAQNRSSHLSALIALIASVVTYFHPGATTSTVTQTVVSAVFAAGAVVIESLHIQWKRDLLGGYNDLLIVERRLMGAATHPFDKAAQDFITKEFQTLWDQAHTQQATNSPAPATVTAAPVAAPTVSAPAFGAVTTEPDGTAASTA